VPRDTNTILSSSSITHSRYNACVKGRTILVKPTSVGAYFPTFPSFVYWKQLIPPSNFLHNLRRPIGPHASANFWPGRAALRAALVYNDFLERKLSTMRGMVSSGYTRGKISPERATSQRLDDWRDISRGDAVES
jgi:hypothetical protein